MSKVKIQGHASGSGVFTLTTPNTSTNRTITLPDASGTLAFTTDDDDKLLLGGGTMTGDLILGDNVKLEIGSASGGDLQIYHDGNNSYIDEAGTGALTIRSNTINLQKYTGETLAEFQADGAVTLRYNNVTKFQTTAAGATVTGVLTADGGIDVDNFNINGTTIGLSSGNMELDSGHEIWLDSNDGNFRIKKAGTDIGMIQTTNNDLILRSMVSNEDILFQGNDAGNAITALTLDMSEGGKAIFNSGLAIGGTGAANTLDDYEQGMWTMQAVGTSTPAGQAAPTATYVKVGELVTCYGMWWGASISGTATAAISGLPFAAKAGTYITGTTGANTFVLYGGSMWGYTHGAVYLTNSHTMGEGANRSGAPRYLSFSLTYRTT